MCAVDLGSTAYSCPRKCEQRQAFHLATASSASTVFEGVHVECVGGGGEHITYEHVCLLLFRGVSKARFAQLWSEMYSINFTPEKYIFQNITGCKNDILSISGDVSGEAWRSCFHWTGGRLENWIELEMWFHFTFLMLYSEANSHLVNVKIFREFSNTTTMFK